MTQSPFSAYFLQAQHISRQLQRDVVDLEQLAADPRNLTIYVNTGTDLGEDDPELGMNNEFTMKLHQIEQLTAAFREVINNAEKNASSGLESSKLHRLEREYQDIVNITQRIHQRVREHRRKIAARNELLAPVCNQPAGGLSASAIDKQAYYNDEQQKLESMLKTVHSTIQNAFTSIDSLQRQRQLFLSIQTTSIRVAEGLGLSNNVISWIRRQENINMLVTVLGCFMTSFIVIVFYLWWRQ